MRFAASLLIIAFTLANVQYSFAETPTQNNSQTSSENSTQTTLPSSTDQTQSSTDTAKTNTTNSDVLLGGQADQVNPGAYTGGDPCISHWKNLPVRDPKDPCASAFLYDKAADYQAQSTYAYGAAAIVCFLSCFAEYFPTVGSAVHFACKAGTGAAGALDITASKAILKAAKEYSQSAYNMQLTAFSVGELGAVVGGLAIATEIGNAALAAGSSSAQAQQQSKNSKDVFSNDGSCLLMVTNAATSIYRGVFATDFHMEAKNNRTQKRTAIAFEAIYKARADYQKKMDEYRQAMANRLHSISQGFAPSSAEESAFLKAQKEAELAEKLFEEQQKANDAQKAQEFAARALASEKESVDDQLKKGTKEPYHLIREFEKQTKKPTHKLVLDAAHNNSNNVVTALAETNPELFNELGKNALPMFKDMTKRAEEKVKDYIRKEKGKFVDTELAFANTKNKTHSKAPKKALSLAKFGRKGGLNLKAKKQSTTTKDVGFATQNAAFDQHVDQDGFYDASISLFEAVNARYAMVHRPLISGQTLIHPEQDQESITPLDSGANSGYATEQHAQDYDAPPQISATYTKPVVQNTQTEEQETQPTPEPTKVEEQRVPGSDAPEYKPELNWNPAQSISR
ncbi:MAG: hypothetical protein AB7F43_13390 [Bacteriovoracia bacterium]